MGGKCKVKSASRPREFPVDEAQSYTAGGSQCLKVGVYLGDWVPSPCSFLTVSGAAGPDSLSVPRLLGFHAAESARLANVRSRPYIGMLV